MRMPICFALLALATLTLSAARAQEPQSLTAQVGELAFESGDAEITLVPVGGTFSLSASTKGAAAWPPPKTRVDLLAIVCDGFRDGKPLSLDHRAFERSTCDVRFDRGTRPMGGEPETRYRLDKDAAENRFEIVRADGKVYEGRFAFRLKDAAGHAVEVSNGSFRIEDRQL